MEPVITRTGAGRSHGKQPEVPCVIHGRTYIPCVSAYGVQFPASPPHQTAIQ